MKKFIITIDTEGDNLWAWKPGNVITTENVSFLNRFQTLCDEFHFQPVYLTNYEMISDTGFVDFISQIEEEHRGELGMHLHAWNTPPKHSIDSLQGGAAYLIEYPTEIMEEKISVLTELIRTRTGITPVSHRAGRWAMDERYFELLMKYEYQVDCSVTPHVNWIQSPGATPNSVGSDYSNYSEQPYWITGKDSASRLLEVPMTIRNTHKIFAPQCYTPRKIMGTIKRGIKGQRFWMRPDGYNEAYMEYLVNQVASSNEDYIMFMIHSSELMPGGNPTFQTKESIEELYQSLRRLFTKLSKSFEGITLRDYYSEFAKKHNDRI